MAALGDGVGEARVRGLGGAPDGRLPDEDEEDEHAAEHVHDAQHAEHHLNGRDTSKFTSSLSLSPRTNQILCRLVMGRLDSKGIPIPVP